MYSGDLWQTKQVSAKHDMVSLSHPWNKPANLLGQTDSLHKNNNNNKKN
jgi:hypothetical protein